MLFACAFSIEILSKANGARDEWNPTRSRSITGAPIGRHGAPSHQELDRTVRSFTLLAAVEHRHDAARRCPTRSR